MKFPCSSIEFPMALVLFALFLPHLRFVLESPRKKQESIKRHSLKTRITTP